jgi:hypothetical protein
MRQEQTSPWNEKEYVKYLDHERHMFAWCLVVYGGVSQPVARSRSEEFYYFEPSDASHRGLVFHDEAWHWAMLQVFGEQYWQLRPELQSASADYRAESQRYELSQQ